MGVCCPESRPARMSLLVTLMARSCAHLFVSPASSSKWSALVDYLETWLMTLLCYIMPLYELSSVHSTQHLLLSRKYSHQLHPKPSSLAFISSAMSLSTGTFQTSCSSFPSMGNPAVPMDPSQSHSFGFKCNLFRSKTKPISKGELYLTLH